MAEVDIATLGIKVDASTADTATKQLDNLANTAEKTETSTKGVTSATSAMQAVIRAAIAAINANTAAMGAYNDRLNANRTASTGAAAACDDFESRASRLRATLDPMAAAIDRVNAELQEARILFEAGAMSAEDYARAQVVLNARSADFARRQGMMNDALGLGARSARLQSHEMLNLSRQFADIGVTAAMGMNPLMILIQQGPQIADVLQTARSRGISTADAFKQMGESIKPFMRFVGPGLVAAAIGFASVGLAVRDLNKNVGDVQKEFGFTEKQMERLKEKGVDLGYTMGDVLSGLGYAIKGSIVGAWGEELDAVDKMWNKFLDEQTEGAIRALKDIVGSFGYAFGAIKGIWELLPHAIGQNVIAAGNFVIETLESMINKSVGLINDMIEGMPAWLKPEGRVAEVKLSRIPGEDDPSKGYMQRGRELYAGIGARAEEGKAQALAGLDAFGELYKKGAGQSREDRLREGAGKGDKGKKPKASDEEKAWEKAVKSAQDYTKALEEQTAEIGKNIFEVKRMETAREAADLKAAAAATGSAANMQKAITLTKQMEKATEDWIKATNAEKIRLMERALSDENKQLEFEATLIGMSHADRERALKLREINIQILAAERDGYIGVAEALRDEAAALGEAAAAKGKREDDVEAAHRTADAARDVADGVREATESFGELFGTIGEGFSNVMNTIFEFTAAQEESKAALADLEREYADGQKSSAQYEFEKGQIQNEMAQQQIANYGNMLSAAKTFFKEGSAGYKVLQAAEAAWRLFQFAMAIKAMMIDKVETASSVSNSGLRAVADGIAGVAKSIASLPFPLNIAAGAATLAFLVAIGVKMFGGGGKGASAGKSASSSAETKMKETYNGPRDQYGAPTSYYSVLEPGATTVAGGGAGASYYGAAAAGGGGFRGGDFTLVVNGGADNRTINEQIVPLMEQYKDATVQDARQAVANDQANRAGRQRIGGG